MTRYKDVSIAYMHGDGTIWAELGRSVVLVSTKPRIEDQQMSIAACRICSPGSYTK